MSRGLCLSLRSVYQLQSRCSSCEKLFESYIRGAIHTPHLPVSTIRLSVNGRTLACQKFLNSYQALKLLTISSWATYTDNSEVARYICVLNRCACNIENFATHDRVYSSPILIDNAVPFGNNTFGQRRSREGCRP
jgi:hypothetical protein